MTITDTLLNVGVDQPRVLCLRQVLSRAVICNLSWADDLVLFSRNKHGLQKCLDNLPTYCDTWQLEVNVDKTKVMVLSSRRTRTEGITFGDDLQCVDTYKYLGLIISSEGSIRKM